MSFQKDLLLHKYSSGVHKSFLFFYFHFLYFLKKLYIFLGKKHTPMELLFGTAEINEILPYGRDMIDITPHISRPPANKSWKSVEVHLFRHFGCYF
jgi:hypothetical protein